MSVLTCAPEMNLQEPLTPCPLLFHFYFTHIILVLQDTILPSHEIFIQIYICEEVISLFCVADAFLALHFLLLQVTLL